MVFVTGDLHSTHDIGKLSTKKFPQQKELSKDDYLIVCGDFGLVWDGEKEDRYWQKWLAQRNFTTLWVDGNHENFELLAKYPKIEMFGGMVQEIQPSVYHLLRGQVYMIGRKKIFTMGGASSHDKWCRVEHLSWWREELPSTAEMERGLDALKANDWKVDYVISHCGPESVQRLISREYENDALTRYFDVLKEKLEYERWYCGHYHINRNFESDRLTVLYNEIRPLGEIA